MRQEIICVIKCFLYELGTSKDPIEGTSKQSKVVIEASNKKSDMYQATYYKVNITDEEKKEAEDMLANPPSDHWVFYHGTWILQRLEFDQEGNTVQMQHDKYPWLLKVKPNFFK